MRTTIILAVVVLCPALCFAQAPTVDIKCNGGDSGVKVNSGDNVKITFDVTAGAFVGNTVDVWVLLKSPFGFFCYDGVGPISGWNYGLGFAYYTGPLADMSGTALDRPLPDGTYKSHAAIDIWADGVLDLKYVYSSDSVDFSCFPPAPPDMVLVPAGAFDMGDHYGVGSPNELPVHTVYIDAFYMDVYEVSNDKYCTYLNSAYGQGLIEVKSGIVYKYGDTETYCDTTTSSSRSRIHWDGITFTVTPLKGDHPMVTVTWYGSVAYSNWRSDQEGLPPCYDLNTWDCTFGAGGYRLPTEAEWEKAARGSEYNPYYQYPWGNSIDGSNANYWQSGDPFEGTNPETTPVGYYDGNQIPSGVDMANGYGLYDMAGNVWEWCNDWYGSSYYSNSPPNNPHGPSSGPVRVLRGGSYYFDSNYLRCANRINDDPGGRYYYFGFRLALD
jgi:formylglycine-generating enzyme required for sulfatase activity